MFCDLVGSTALSEQLDPEELREVVRAYQQTGAAVIERYEGHIAQYLGDGLLVYFGYPQAHEDDAQRAVRAGLGIIAALQQREPSLPREKSLQVRIGIHTGLVVIGEIGGGAKRELLALGETPNVAARIQGLAAPDTVAISTATHRLVEGFFAHRSLGPRELKGISTPMEVYEVLAESGIRSRFEAAATTGLTPLVGREQEAGLLLERWARVNEGSGQVVLLSGEAGIGKSRLVQVLKEQVPEEPRARLECHCSPYFQNSAFYPLIDLLQREFHLKRDDSPEEKLRKLEAGLLDRPTVQPSDGLEVPLFASLLSIPLPERYPPLALTPQKQKEKIQQAVLAWLLKESERHAVLSVWEDLQWADPSTLEFLGLLINQGPTVRILTLLTFRPEFTPPWALRSHLTQLTLSRLPRNQAEVMVARVTGGRALPAEVLQQVVSKTDGVPLFVEELTKMVLESGLLRPENRHYELTGPLPPLAIPATLQDALMARLDRLAAVRDVAQLGATLGREFPYELIHAVSLVEEAKLQEALAKLVEAEVLYQTGLPPQASYVFKHALIQETAYQSLLKSKRQQYHQQIAAQVLEERFPEVKETQPELLAHHYTEAGLIAQAIPYWQSAGQKAIQRSANLEAIAHLTKALELLKTLPDTPERAQQELMLRLPLGMSLMVTKGWAAPEVEKVLARNRELCRQLGETPQLFPVLRGLHSFYVMRAEYEAARALGEQRLTLAQSTQDSAFLVEAHHTLGQTLLFLGEFAQAQAHLSQGFALYDPQQHSAHAFMYGYDPGSSCLSYEAVAWQLLGYPDRAVGKIQQALALARELSQPSSLAIVSTNAAVFRQLRREGALTQELAEGVTALSTEYGFAEPLAIGSLQHGWAVVEQGGGEEGITELRQGMAAYKATGSDMVWPWMLALLAESYAKVGQMEAGLTALAEALAAGDRSHEGIYEAELHRRKGELTLKQFRDRSSEAGVPSTQAEVEAEACFQKAIEVAQRQQAKSWELRATTSLSRLWQQQGKKAEARQRLAEIYGWFTEGFDTKDLHEAKTLLDTLT
jgi:class 3 adenylate cyclase/predicted ATPase